MVFVANPLLLFSSLFFLVPSFYAFYNELYFLATVSAMTSIISVNYWIHPVPGFRRKLDMFFANLSFCIYYMIGVFYIHNCILLHMLYPGIVVMVLLYIWSVYLHASRICNTWINFHFFFHVMVTFCKLLVIYGTVEKIVN